MNALELRGITKTYDKFTLNNVSFSLEQGYIMGFIGSNGAGKTTTIKSILNLIHVDSGEVSVLGKDFRENEIALKQDIGYAFGGVDYYEKRKIKQVSSVVKRFYHNWNETIYDRYMKAFKLDENKRIGELSRGMKVKYELVLALSHEAKLFILDEPTSGLDPVARDQLLEIFQELVEDGEKSILFSTHITTDLEKCADYITFINEGNIVKSDTYEDFIDDYRVIKGNNDLLTQVADVLIATKKTRFGFSGLIKAADYTEIDGIVSEKPTLDDIMIFYSKKEA